jgi:uncharacterized repeat protein (TIGR01451 family)
VGGEFQVNQSTVSDEEDPDVAKAPDGSFVVVWDADYDDYIYGRRFSSSGTPLTGDFQIDQGGYYNYDARIDGDAAGAFVVVWTKSPQECAGGEGCSRGNGPDYIIYHRRIDSSGSPVGNEFQVSQPVYGTGYFEYNYNADVSKAAAGNFVVVWQHYYEGEGNDRILGRRFGSDGSPLADQFEVDFHDGNGRGYLRDPSVSHNNSSGEFVVVWSSYGLGDTDDDPECCPFRDIVGRRYDSSGMPIGGEFQVNTSTYVYTYGPRISHDTAGNFVVVWNEEPGTTEGYLTSTVQLRRFDSSGSPLGDQFQVSQNMERNASPDISHDQCGNFIVTWELYRIEAFSEVLGRAFDSSGSPLTGELIINTFTTSYQEHPAVSHDGANNFVVVWESYAQDGNNEGVFGQRFLNSADLDVPSLTDMPDPVNPGQNITYSISVANNGPICSAATLTDMVPPDTTFVSFTQATAGPGTWMCTTPMPGGTGTVTCTNSSFGPGAMNSFTMVVNVNPGTPGGTIITNMANILGTTFDPNTANNSRSTMTTVAALGQPDLTINKTVDPSGQVMSGDVLTYTITVQNIGTAPATGVVVLDPVPADTTYVGGSCFTPQGSCSLNGANVEFLLGTVNNGSTVVLTFQVVVDPGLPPGVIVNTGYTVDSNETAPVQGQDVINTLVPAELIEFEAK